MPISSKQRAQLRGLAMELDTIIQVGKGGISDSLVESVNAALKARQIAAEQQPEKLLDYLQALRKQKE